MKTLSWLRDWATSAITVGWASLVTGGLWLAVGAILVFSVYGAARPLPKPKEPHIPASTTTAEGTAVICVLAWLQAGPDQAASLRPCFPTVDLRETEALPASRIGRATAVGSEELAVGYWSVTVAVEVLPAPATTTSVLPGLTSSTPTTTPPATTRYYRLGVRSDGTRYTAPALPEPTGAPVGGPHPELLVGDLERPGPNDPIAATVQNYLSALLAGTGELSRYVWPNAPIAAVSPPPYAAVTLLRMASAETDKLRREVLAEAQATDADGLAHLISVPLEVARRQGRWEVSKTLPAPTLTARQPTAPPTTTPATRPASPTTSTTARPAR